jgi:hypothetical protein
MIGGFPRNIIMVQGIVPMTTTNPACTFTDDDDRLLQQLNLLPAGQNSPLPRNQQSSNVVKVMNPAFAPAFITLADANAMGWNPNQQIPFKLHAGLGLLDGNGGIFRDAKDVFDSEVFWAHTSVYGYEGSEGSDRDPDTESLEQGVTPKRTGIYLGGVSGLYVEVIRESAQPNLEAHLSAERIAAGQSEYWRWIGGITAHELGHAPGDQSIDADHNEGELMIRDGLPINAIRSQESFGETTISRFRKAEKWNE